MRSGGEIEEKEGEARKEENKRKRRDLAGFRGKPTLSCSESSSSQPKSPPVFGLL